MKQFRIWTLFISVSFFALQSLPAESGDISVHVNNGAVEITGMGGTANTGVNTGCIKGNGTVRTIRRDIRPFTELSIDGVFDAQVTTGGRPCVEITGDDNILPHIITKIDGNMLKVSTDTSICTSGSLKLNVIQDNIEKVLSDGANTITVTGISNSSFTLGMDGSGDAEVSGKTGLFTAEISGAGTLKAKDLKARDVKVSVDGSGEAYVNASGSLDASIDGAGDIYYYGHPPEISRRLSGAGDIAEAGE